MKKSFQSTLVLAAVFAGLLAWYFIVEKKIRPQSNEAEEKSKQVVTLQADEIQIIDVTRMKNAPGDADPMAPFPEKPEFEKISLKKTGTDWNLMAPIADAADNAAVGNQLSALVQAKWERNLDENPKDLAQFGLNPPILVITVRKSSEAPPQVVKVGRNTPTGYGAYIMMGEGKAVYKASRSLRSGFDKDAKSLRRKAILQMVRSDIGTIEINKTKESIVLNRSENKESKDADNWVLAREHLPTETVEVQKSLNALVDAKAVDFVSETGTDLAKWGLNKPAIHVTVTSAKDKSRVSLSINKQNDKVYLKVDSKPVIYQVEKDLFTKLDRPATAYRSMRLANFNRFDVQRIKIAQGKESYELLRGDNSWSIVKDPKLKVDGAKVDNLLTQIQDIRIKEYLPNHKADVNEPSLAIHIFEKKDGKENEKVTLKFAGAAQKWLGIRQDLEFPFLLNDGDFKKLNMSQKDFELKEEPKKDGKDETTPPPSKKT